MDNTFASGKGSGLHKLSYWCKVQLDSSRSLVLCTVFISIGERGQVIASPLAPPTSIGIDDINDA